MHINSLNFHAISKLQAAFFTQVYRWEVECGRWWKETLSMSGPKGGGALKSQDSCFSIESRACSCEVCTPDIILPQLACLHKRQKKAWCDDS